MKNNIIHILLIIILTCNVSSCANGQEGKAVKGGKAVMENLNNGRKANHLINEKSPYLLQHAYNPVDWYPWGDEAFEKAKRENKAIFLSIGYSTCHWCHVMEHESFEDSSVAEIMNKYFVAIKVDREERPDIDNIYMTACQMLTGSGGWPLTIIMTPDKKPFYAGTYIPKETRYGRIGLLELLPKIENVWQNERDKINENAAQIASKLQSVSYFQGGGTVDKSIFAKGFNSLSSIFDNKNGGFGKAPKFPTSQNLLFLLRYWHSTKDAKALQMVEKTLTQMRNGGIFDQIGFGFHRYSTDNHWLLPHFEKMLYDQAMLALAYTETYQATGNELYKETAEQIFTYVLRDLTSDEGGFYSAEDADSDGEEGKFYVWSIDEINRLLNKEDAKFFIDIYNFRKNGNFTEQTKRISTETNIPHLTLSILQIAKKYGATVTDIKSRIERIRKTLFVAREKRIHPFKDDKILTDWNGLMIAALSKAGRVFDNVEYTKAAEKAADFILRNLSSGKRLLHRYRKGDAVIKGNLDDYSFFTFGLLELYETTFKPEYLRKAMQYTEIMRIHFGDNKDGGFYFTPDDGEKLLVRTKEIYDAAIPSGNSLAFYDLVKLGRITADTKYEELSSKLIKTFSANIEQNPTGVSFLLTGLQFELGKSFEIVIVGEKSSANYRQMLKTINSKYIPNKVLILIDAEKKEEITKLAPFTKSYTGMENKTIVYVCENYVCSLPVNNKENLMKLLKI